MFDQVYAITSSVIWAFSPIYYRVFMKRFEFVTLNLIRNAMAAAVLALPALYVGLTWGFGFAFVSGAVTLAVGDSLFLLAVREVGASIASPVVYTYILFIQLTAGAVGEVVPAANYLAASLVVLGVFLLSRGGEAKRARTKGLAIALGAGIVWAGGQDALRLATGTGANVVAITFSRNLAAAVVLAVVFLVSRGHQRLPAGVKGKEIGFIAFIALSDLVVGSLLFVYSVSLIGVALSVILTSLSPLLTQLFSKALGKESPSLMDVAGGAIIVSAVLIAIIY